MDGWLQNIADTIIVILFYDNCLFVSFFLLTSRVEPTARDITIWVDVFPNIDMYRDRSTSFGMSHLSLHPSFLSFPFLSFPFLSCGLLSS